MLSGSGVIARRFLPLGVGRKSQASDTREEATAQKRVLVEGNSCARGFVDLTII